VFASGEIVEFPPLIILYFLVFFALAANMIDIKDYEEDGRAGIRTLPVLVGLDRSKLLVGVFLLLAHGAAPFAFGCPDLFLPAVGIGIVQCWLVNRRHYQEKWVFALYLLSLAALVVALV
jgi:4-hydroxybenzoate polyprenyltransferase